MITFRLDPKQLNDLKKIADPKRFEQAIDIALFNIGEGISSDAKNDAPYKTGTLRRSINSQLGKGYVEVGTDVVYAAIHEFGGRTGRNHSVQINAKPYMMPAYEKMVNGRAIDIMAKEINLILE